MTRKVCLDTMIMIWGIKNECEPEQEEKRIQANAFLQGLNDEKVRVIVPSVVIGEFLCKVSREKYPEVLSLLNRRFIISPFDLKAASKYAEIWKLKHENGTVFELKQNNNSTRTCIKADLMIVATAHSADADVIYSEDEDIHKLAEGIVPFSKMPNIATQLPLLQ
jgi:predicted nucleic acid-binding protein